MPKYDYHCKKCGHEFELVMSIQEHETSKRKGGKIRCPKCESREAEPLIEPFFVTTSKKS